MFYVQKDFQCKVIDCTVIADVMEILTIEIYFTKFKSIFWVACTELLLLESFVNTVVDILGTVCDKK